MMSIIRSLEVKLRCYENRQYAESVGFSLAKWESFTVYNTQSLQDFLLNEWLCTFTGGIEQPNINKDIHLTPNSMHNLNIGNWHNNILCSSITNDSWYNIWSDHQQKMEGSNIPHLMRSRCFKAQLTEIPYGRKFWRGIYFGGLAVLRAIRQYFIRQKLHSVMSSLLRNHSLCTRLQLDAPV